MKVANEKKGIFSFHSHNMKKKFHREPFRELMFPLKLFVIN